MHTLTFDTRGCTYVFPLALLAQSTILLILVALVTALGTATELGVRHPPIGGKQQHH